jgi:hypothetical protein
MTDCSHEEGIVPAGAFDFAPQGCGVGESSQDVEGEPAKNGEVLGSIVLSRAVAILGEMDIEHPMKPVLDAPVTAGDMQQPFGGEVFGQEIMANDRRIGALPRRRLREVIRPIAATPGKRWMATKLALRMTVARRASRRSWVELSICSALLRLPNRANCCATALNKGPRLALIAST